MPYVVKQFIVTQHPPEATDYFFMPFGFQFAMT